MQFSTEIRATTHQMIGLLELIAIESGTRTISWNESFVEKFQGITRDKEPFPSASRKKLQIQMATTRWRSRQARRSQCQPDLFIDQPTNRVPDLFTGNAGPAKRQLSFRVDRIARPSGQNFFGCGRRLT